MIRASKQLANWSQPQSRDNKLKQVFIPIIYVRNGVGLLLSGQVFPMCQVAKQCYPGILGDSKTMSPQQKNMYEHHHQDFNKNPDQVRILHSIRFFASNWKPKVDKAVQRASSALCAFCKVRCHCIFLWRCIWYNKRKGWKQGHIHGRRGGYSGIFWGKSRI